MNDKLTLLAMFSAAALLTACGGGSDDSPAAPPAATDTVPDSASASVLGLKNYLVELSTMLVDDKEPVDVSNFAPKTADDAEPEPIG